MEYEIRVIVVGGGLAGLMAFVAAAENDAHVLLIDKGDKLGRKLAISGGGRCNVTNPTGGYNITAAFVTGHAVGCSAAEKVS